MLLTIVAVGISVLWALGLYSLLGYSYNVLSSMLLPLIVVLAIADDVHMMQHWDEERRHKSAEESFKATVAHLVTPLLGASATTALGMLSLATSNVVAVQVVRRRRRGRHHGGLRHLAGVRADHSGLMKPELGAPPHEKYLVTPMRRIAAFSTRRPAARAHRRAAALGDRGRRHPPPASGHQPHQLLQSRSIRSGSPRG